MFESIKSWWQTKAVPLSSPAAMELFGGACGVFEHSRRRHGGSESSGLQRRRPVNLLEAVGSLDWRLVREAPDGRETIAAANHPVAQLLRQPCPWISETEFKRTLVADYLLWGNGLAIVARVNGEPREIYRADPRVTSIVQDMSTGEPSYSVAMTEGGTREYGWRDIVHIRNTCLRRRARARPGQSRERSRRAVSLLLESYASGLFARGARPGGILEMPGKMTAEVMTRLRQSFSAIYSGSENAGRTANFWESGVKFQALQISSVDAQFIELRKFQIQEAARHLNIAPILLADIEHASLNNSAELRQMYLDMTLLPIIELFEDALELALLSDDDRAQGYCIEFDTSNFVRNDIEKRFAAYKSGIELGVYLLNEARDREGLPPVEGGSTPMRSVQTVPLNSDGTTPAPARAERRSRRRDARNKAAPL